MYVIRIGALIGILLLAGCGGKDAKSGQKSSPKKVRISISGAFALYPMAVLWSEEYRNGHSMVEIDISAGGAGKGMADVLGGMVDMAMVSRAVYPAEAEQGAWWVAVARDAVIPVINEANPYARELKKRGLRVEEFQSLWLQEPAPSWEELLAFKEKTSGNRVHVYTRSDACGAAETWALFLGKKQEHLKGLGVFGDPGLALAVKRDVLGIGYNNVNYAYDPSTHQPHSGLTILPLDLDGNGRIDDHENFYSTRDALVQAITEGRYPSPPARDLYMVCKGKPGRPEVRELLEWILTRGQERLVEGGYISPGDQTVRDALKKLSES